MCFSHLRWNFVYQRPQHLLSRAAADQPVFYVEEPLFEQEGVLPRLHLAPQPCGVTVAVPILRSGTSEAEQVAAQRMLIERVLADYDADEITFWYYTPMALRFTDHIRPDLCVYDCMDELSAFKHAPPALMSLERRLLERADLVFTGGQSLYEAKRHRHARCYRFPSSVDVAHFARARQKAKVEPPDQSAIAHPRIGFFGVIDERMDLDLLAHLAQLRPDLQFVLVGPVVKIDPAGLPRAANIHWLGPKSYTELPDYLAGWEAAFMPFALNESTRFISPTKTPEFLAAGAPVCSTPIRDVVTPYADRGLVEIATDAADFSDKLDLLLSDPGPDWLLRVDRFLEGMSWDRTWTDMSTLMATSRRVAPERERVHDEAAGLSNAGAMYV